MAADVAGRIARPVEEHPSELGEDSRVGVDGNGTNDAAVCEPTPELVEVASPGGGREPREQTVCVLGARQARSHIGGETSCDAGSAADNRGGNREP